MSLKEQINAAIKDALRSGDETRKATLRQLMAGIRQAELEQRTAKAKTLGGAVGLTDEQVQQLDALSLSDEDVLAVIQKEAKSRRESIADAEKAGRPDLVADNRAELAVLEGYLPQTLTRDELVELARAAIAEAGVTDAKGLGAVMKLLTPRTKGRADGRQVNEVVRELLG